MREMQRRCKKRIAFLLVMVILSTPIQQAFGQGSMAAFVPGGTEDEYTGEPSCASEEALGWIFGPIDFEEGASRVGQTPESIWVQDGSGMSGTYQNYGSDNIAFEFKKNQNTASGEMDFPVPSEIENRTGKLVYEFDMAANSFDTQWSFLLDCDFHKYPLFEFHRDTLGYINVFNEHGLAEAAVGFGTLEADTVYKVTLVLDMDHATQSLFIDEQAVYLGAGIADLPIGGSYRTLKLENCIGNWGSPDAAIYLDNLKSYQYAGVPDDSPCVLPAETPVITPTPAPAEIPTEDPSISSEMITFGNTPIDSVTFEALNAFSAPGTFWGVGDQDEEGRLAIVADPAEASNMVLRLTDLKNPTTYFNFEPDFPQPIDTVFAFKLRAPMFGAYGYGWNIRYRTQNDEEKPLFALHGWDEGNADRIFITAGGTPVSTSVDLSVDTWYSFQIVFHYEAGTFDLLINGEEAAADVEIPGGLGENVKCLAFINNREQDDITTLYLDDLRYEVKSENTPAEPTSTPPEGSDEQEFGPGDEVHNTIFGKFSLSPRTSSSGTAEYWFENDFDLPPGKLPALGNWNLPAPYDTYNSYVGSAVYSEREIIDEPDRNGVLKLTKKHGAALNSSLIVQRCAEDHPEINLVDLFVYEFDFKISDRTHNWMFGFNGYDFVTIPNSNFGQGIRDGIGDIWVSENRWNTLSIEVNRIDNTYSVYLNRYKIKENIPAPFDLKNEISCMEFKSNYQEPDSIAGSSLFLDNFVGYPAEAFVKPAPDLDKTVWFENTFDELTEQTLPSGLGFWKIDAPAGSQYDTYVNNRGSQYTAREIVAESGRGNVLKLTKSKNAGVNESFKVWRGVWDHKYPIPDINQANEFVYEFDFKVTNENNNWMFGFNDFDFVTIPNYNGKWALRDKTRDISIDCNTWYTLIIEINKLSNTYHVYLNGTRVKTDLAVPFDLTATKLQYFSFSSNYKESGKTDSSLYIDNFKGYPQTSVRLGEKILDKMNTASGEKWYTFYQSENAPVEIILDRIPENHSLELYDSNFNLVTGYIYDKKDRALEIHANLDAGVYHIKVASGQTDQPSSEEYSIAVNPGERVLYADQSYSIQTDGASTFVFQPESHGTYQIRTTGDAKTGCLFTMFKDGIPTRTDSDQQTEFSVQTDMRSENKYYISINEGGHYTIQISRIEDSSNMSLSVGDVQAASGGETTVPIYLNNASGKKIEQIAVKLDFGGETISPVEIVPAQGSMFYKANDNEIIISGADLGGDTNYFTDGKLCDVKVRVSGAEDDTLSVSLSKAAANTESDIVYPSVSAGSVSIQPGQRGRSAYTSAPVFSNHKLYFKENETWVEATHENIVAYIDNMSYYVKDERSEPTAAANGSLAITDPLNDERHVYDANRDGIVDEQDFDLCIHCIEEIGADTLIQDLSVSLEDRLVLKPDLVQGMCWPTMGDARNIMRYTVGLETPYNKTNPVFQSVRPTGVYVPNKTDEAGKARLLKVATTTNAAGEFTAYNQLLIKNTSGCSLYLNALSNGTWWKTQREIPAGQTIMIDGLKGLYFISITRSADDEEKAVAGDFEVRLVEPSTTNITGISSVSYNGEVGPMVGNGNTLRFQIDRSTPQGESYYIVPYLSWNNTVFYEKPDNGINVTLSGTSAQVTIHNIALTSSGNTLYTKFRIFDRKDGALLWEGPNPAAENMKSQAVLQTIQLDDEYCAMQRIDFNAQETYIQLDREIPAGKTVVASFLTRDVTEEPALDSNDWTQNAGNYIEEYIKLYDENYVPVFSSGGWYHTTRTTYNKVEHGGRYQLRIKFKNDMPIIPAWISIYTTDHVTQSSSFEKYDALEQNQGAANNYLMFNASEDLGRQDQLGENYYYVAKMPVSGNANIYWEHWNNYGKNMTYGFLLHNTGESDITVTINKKSAYADKDFQVPYRAPLEIWNDYFQQSFISNLTIEGGEAQWIYLDNIPTELYNGIINLSVPDGKTLECYEFITNNTTNANNVKWDISNGYSGMYQRASTGDLLAGTTDGPYLVSNLGNINSGYKLLLTGFDAPRINQGEMMPLYYDGVEVTDNAVNYSVVYKFNVSRFTGTKVVFEFNPYTNFNYLPDPHTGLYVAYDIWQNGVQYEYKSQVLLQPKYYAGYSTEFELNLETLASEKYFDINQPFSLYVVVSGMSSMPLLMRFE